jgi:hypothetical protein
MLSGPSCRVCLRPARHWCRRRDLASHVPSRRQGRIRGLQADCASRATKQPYGVCSFTQAANRHASSSSSSWQRQFLTPFCLLRCCRRHPQSGWGCQAGPQERHLPAADPHAVPAASQNAQPAGSKGSSGSRAWRARRPHEQLTRQLSCHSIKQQRRTWGWGWL